jgi:phosphopantothenoylcysteine synthetase/decarboxylase
MAGWAITPLPRLAEAPHDQRMSLRCLITAGPTREYLDPVRYLSNGSSGKMGYALAEAALARGWEVDLVSGPVALQPPEGARLVRVVSTEEMLAACRERFPSCDLLIMAAAPADYRPASMAPEKLKKGDGGLELKLAPTPDILKHLATLRRNGQTVVGFAAETQRVEEYAQRKLREKSLDWIVANDVSQPGIGMESDANAVLLLGRGGERAAFGPAPKREVADFILGRVCPVV